MCSKRRIESDNRIDTTSHPLPSVATKPAIVRQAAHTRRFDVSLAELIHFLMQMRLKHDAQLSDPSVAVRKISCLCDNLVTLTAYS